MSPSGMIKNLRFLTTSQVERLHSAFFKRASAPARPDLLDSAVHSPINAKCYRNQGNLFQLAAELAVKISRNHAYVDGNKRTALLAADMFLKINGYGLPDLASSLDELSREDGRRGETFDTVTLATAHNRVATGSWTAEQLGRFYQSAAIKIKAAAPEVHEYSRGASIH